MPRAVPILFKVYVLPGVRAMIETVGSESPHSNSDYQIVSQLSANESGLLYRAIMNGTGSEVDLWVLSGMDDVKKQRIRKRIVVASHLHHPAAAWVIDSSRDGDHPSYLLEPVANRSLSNVTAEISGSKRRVLDFGKQLASVVAAAHRLGLVHGNLSPETVFVRQDGSLQLDFVRPRSSGEIETLRVDGPHETIRKPFRAPEVVDQSDRDAAADVFSVAATLIWLFTGRQGDPVSELPTLRDHLGKWFGDWSVPEKDLDAFCNLLIESLQPHPWDRASSREISAHLERLFDTCVDDAVTTAHLDQTSDALAMTSDFEVASRGDASLAEPIGVGFQIGRFRVRRKLGEGGMGAVFEAEDPSDGSLVAVKMLSRRLLNKQEAVRRFRKEARLLGEIKSPYVTNLLEVNEDKGLHYIVMEYVAGVDLHRLIRHGAPFEEKVALSIIADTARGLVSSHQRDIIHRDIKPANILLACEMRGEGNGDQRITLSLETLKHFHVKLSDFGLARQIEQTESMDMTRSGGVLGTPNYMAPEQFTDSTKISPATDVYALGVTLFEMLAGKPPFESSDLTKLIHLHCQEHPPSLQRLNPKVSDATCELVQRAMAKDSRERYADAGQFLRDIERLLRGEATNISLHPETPPHLAGEVFEEVFEWHLKSPAGDLWPAVSNTERINCAVGVPSVVYETRRDEHGRLRKFGNFRMAGLQIGWEEHPFEWVEGQRLGILREFHQGPFVWFLSTVELIPQVGGGTLLRHTVRIKPRGLVGRLVAALEVSVKGKRNLDRVYHRIDASVSGALGSAPTLDPFCEQKELPKTRRQRLEQRLDRMASRGIDHDVIECLGSFLREAPSQELARVRPLALARNFGIDGDRMLRGCLAAAKEGLLELHWDILCPTCRISSQIADTLRSIENHSRCEVCDLDFEVDLAESIEMIFRVSPEIREAELGTFCIGGPEHSPHVVLQVRLAAGKRVELAPLLTEGEFVLRSAQLTYNFHIRVLATKGTTHTELVLSPDFDPKLESQVRAGRNVITITNDYDHDLVVRLERITPRQDVVTAAQASALPQFRELFPDETPQIGRLMNVATAAFLAIDLCDTESLFFERADGDAYVVVSKFQRLAEQIAEKHCGALVKAIGTELLLAFETPSNAFLTALELAETVEREESAVRFCAALHHGTTLATVTNGHLDYFGGTVHLVQRLLRLAGPGEMVLSESVAAEPIVVSEVRERKRRSEVCDFPQFGQFGLRCQRVWIA